MVSLHSNWNGKTPIFWFLWSFVPSSVIFPGSWRSWTDILFRTDKEKFNRSLIPFVRKHARVIFMVTSLVLLFSKCMFNANCVQHVVSGLWDLQGAKSSPLPLWILCSSSRVRVWIEVHGESVGRGWWGEVERRRKGCEQDRQCGPHGTWRERECPQNESCKVALIRGQVPSDCFWKGPLLLLCWVSSMKPQKGQWKAT